MLTFTNYSVYADAAPQTPPALFGLQISGVDPLRPVQPFQIQAASNVYAAAAGADSSGGFLVAWEQRVTGPNQEAQNTVFAARVSAAGVPLDTSPLTLSSGLSQAGAPTVACDGADFLVAWVDSVVPSIQTGYESGVWARRVTRAGTVLDGLPAAGAIQLSSSEARARSLPVAAFNGSEYIVAWHDQGTVSQASGSIRGARVTPSGTVPSGAGYEIVLSDVTLTNLLSLAAAGNLIQLTGFAIVGLMSLAIHPF